MSIQISNTMPPTVWQFLWHVIKPYRWWYALMLQAPVLTAFYIFANNYSFKLVVLGNGLGIRANACVLNLFSTNKKNRLCER